MTGGGEGDGKKEGGGKIGRWEEEERGWEIGRKRGAGKREVGRWDD